MNLGIRTKILIICAIVAVAPLSVGILYSSQLYSENLKQQIFQGTEAVAAACTRTFFSELQTAGGLVQQASAILDHLPQEDWRISLSDLKGASTRIIALGVVDSSGRVLAVSEPERWASSYIGVGADLSGKEWFREASGGKSYPCSEGSGDTVYYSRPALDSSLSRQEVPVVQLFAEEFRGVDGADYLLFMVYDWFYSLNTAGLAPQEMVYGTIGAVVGEYDNSGLYIWADTNLVGRIGTILGTSSLGDGWLLYTAIKDERAPSLDRVEVRTAEYSLNGQPRVVTAAAAPSWYPYAMIFIGYLTNPEAAYAFIDGVRNQVVLIASVVAIAGVVSGLFTTRGMTRRITKLAEAAARVSSGDLTVTFGSRGTGGGDGSGKGDEIDRLSGAFSVMVSNLRGVISKVSASSDRASDFAESLGSSSEELSSSANQVSQSVQQISTGIQDQAKTVNEIAVEARTTLGTMDAIGNATLSLDADASQAGEHAGEAKGAGEAGMAKLDAIQSAAKRATELSASLNEKSKQIISIVSTIREMADQTSLLALNAAIEAARAGEAGKGFAVVADEVRKLAEESRKSADQVSVLVNNITASTKAAADAMGEVEANVESGGTTIREALSKLDSISDAISGIAGRVRSLKDSIETGTAAVKKIEEGISGLASVSEESAASSEEITSAVEEQTAAIEKLSGMAQELVKTAAELKEEVKRFNV